MGFVGGGSKKVGPLAELKCKLQEEGRAGKTGGCGRGDGKGTAAQGASQGRPSVPLLSLSGSASGWGC